MRFGAFVSAGAAFSLTAAALASAGDCPSRFRPLSVAGALGVHVAAGVALYTNEEQHRRLRLASAEDARDPLVKEARRTILAWKAGDFEKIGSHPSWPARNTDSPAVIRWSKKRV